MKAVLCPICHGDGNEWEKTDVKRGEPDKIWMKFCHGCYGRGWVEVSNADDRLKPIDSVSYSQPPDYNKCPACSGDRSSPALTGCPKGSHYGTLL